MQSYQLGRRVTPEGSPLSGGLAYFYQSGTTTPADVYEDDALASEYSHPVVADSAGFFPELVYLDPNIEYRLVIKTATGETIAAYSADPINTPQAEGGVDGATINDDSIPAEAFAPGAIEEALGFTPQESLSGLTAHEINVLFGRVGEVIYVIGNTAPAGALKLNGQTIGSASSGGTARANADTADLFARIWALDATAYPITTSAGAGSTRGADAAADFAANKRLPLPDMRGEFLRGWDDARGVDGSRVLGASQDEMVGTHTHTVGASYDFSNGGQAGINPVGTSISTDPNTGTENRPRNVAWLVCTRY